MATIRTKIFAGGTIDLAVTLDKNLNEYEKLFIYLYTNDRNIVKFKYPFNSEIDTAYNQISEGETANVANIKLLSKHTAKFDGCLYFLAKLIDDSTELTENELVGGVDTTIDIITNLIKNES